MRNSRSALTLSASAALAQLPRDDGQGADAPTPRARGPLVRMVLLASMASCAAALYVVLTRHLLARFPYPFATAWIEALALYATLGVAGELVTGVPRYHFALKTLNKGLLCAAAFWVSLVLLHKLLLAVRAPLVVACLLPHAAVQLRGRGPALRTLAAALLSLAGFMLASVHVEPASVPLMLATLVAMALYAGCVQASPKLLALSFWLHSATAGLLATGALFVTSPELTRLVFTEAVTLVSREHALLLASVCASGLVALLSLLRLRAVAPASAVTTSVAGAAVLVALSQAATAREVATVALGVVGFVMGAPQDPRLASTLSALEKTV